jgi:hypothetical protein
MSRTKRDDVATGEAVAAAYKAVVEAEDDYRRELVKEYGHSAEDARTDWRGIVTPQLKLLHAKLTGARREYLRLT